MNKTLQHLAILSSVFFNIACNATTQEDNVPVFSSTQSVANHPNAPKMDSNLRGTPDFKKTSEYNLLRTRLLNAWMPMCELSEGYFPYIYRCSAGKPTVGIGTNMVACSIPLYDMPLYTKSGRRLTVSEIKSWMNKTAGKNKSECRRLANELGYRGISHADAEHLAHKEAKLKVDLVHDKMLSKHGMELFDQPLPIQMLILDLTYQRGQDGVFRNAALWKCLKNKDYENAHRYVVCCPNKSRNTVKRSLVHLANSCKKGTDTSAHLATLGKFNIKFDASDLYKDIFIAANIDYRPKTTPTPSIKKNPRNNNRPINPRRKRRGRRG
ncbi:MAG: hypothetical protein IKV03_05810 [Alphaproteobacteria bacterium]|nr:hypothetical protein [Alphaproteobacteria bacterium]